MSTQPQKQAREAGSSSTRLALRQAGMRVTDFRLRVFAALQGSSEPLSVLQIQPKVGGDPVTLYRTLLAFVEHGLAHRISADHRTWLYAAGSTPGQSIHPHFVCQRCGKVSCVEGKLAQAALLAAMHVPAEYTVRACDVILHGQCASCRSKRQIAE